MTRRQRQLRSLIILIVAVVIATAIALAVSLPEDPAQRSPEQGAAFVDSLPVPLPAGSVAGLEADISSTASGSDQRYASTLVVPGVPSYSATISTFLDDLLSRYIRALDETPVATGELSVDTDITAAAGTYLGISVSTFVSVGGGSGVSTSRTDWVNTESGLTTLSSELIKPERESELAQVVVEALEQDAPEAILPAEERADLDALNLTQDLRFTPDGSLHVVLDETSGLLHTAAGVHSVTVPRTVALHFLTDEAAEITATVASGERPADLQAPAEDTAWEVPEAVAAADCAVERCIALTFDDGPSRFTGQVLDALNQAGARASFMVVGENATTQPLLLRRALDEGHQLINHTWDHPDLTDLDATEIADQVRRTDEAIAAATGQAAPHSLRPPYGAINEQVTATLRELGKAIVLWDVDTEDWKNRSAEATTQRALDGAYPGAIVLMHDIHESTAEAVPTIVADLTERGYRLVTVDELLGPTQPGVQYSARR